MADVKISALPTVVTPAGTDVVPCVQGGTTKSETVAQILSVRPMNPAIIDADVNAAAAIAGTKVSPNFGAQAIATTGSLSLGTGPYSSTGDMRGGADLLITHNVGGVDRNIIEGTSGADVLIGDPANGGNVICRAPSAGFIYSQVAGNNVLIAGNGYVNIGAGSYAATGLVRMPNNTNIVARNVANSADIILVGSDASNNVVVGGDASGGTASGQTFIDSINFVYLRPGGTTALLASTNAISIGLPLSGNSSPYAGMNGTFSKTLTAAQSYDLAGTEYSMSDLQFVSNGANVIRLPPVTLAGNSYFKFIQNVSGGGTIAVKDTNNVTAAAALASGTGAWFRVGVGTVKQVSAAFTVA